MPSRIFGLLLDDEDDGNDELPPLSFPCFFFFGDLPRGDFPGMTNALALLLLLQLALLLVLMVPPSLSSLICFE